MSEVTFDLGFLDAGALRLTLRTVASEGLCVYETQYIIQEVAYAEQILLMSSCATLQAYMLGLCVLSSADWYVFYEGVRRRV